MRLLLFSLSWALAMALVATQNPKTNLLNGNLRGDPGDLVPLDLLKTPLSTQPRPAAVQQTQRLSLPLRGDLGELAAEESRGSNKRQSYNRHYKPRNTHYNRMNRHSDAKKGKGGFQNSNSYNGQSGYSTKSSYDRAKKDAYGDSDHKQSKKGDRRHGNSGHDFGRGSAGHRFLYGEDDEY